MKPSELIAQFLADADVVAGSKKMYDFAIRRFFLWVHFHKIPVDGIKKHHILSYKEELTRKEPKLTINTQKNYLSVVKMFFVWAENNNHMENVAANIRRIKFDDNTFRKDYLSREEVNKLLASYDTTTEKGSRDYAITLLMVTSGLRRNEVVTLDYADIAEKEGKQGIWVMGKGRNEKQFVSITGSTMDAINDYLVQRNELTDESPLFASCFNKRMTPGWLSKLIKGRLTMIGLTGKTYSCHSLRHTTACLLVETNENMNEIQQLMRHKSPVTTQIYTRVVNEKIRLENKAGKAIESLIYSDPLKRILR